MKGGYKNGLKKCCCCKQWLPLSDFGNNKSKWDGLASECKKCVVKHSQKYAKTKQGQKSRKRYNSSKKGKLTNKNGHLRYRYNITLKEYDRMFKEQKGVCAVCGRVETHKTHHGKVGLSVDHNHKTGKIRGLLCTKCNTALGIMEENKELMLKLINYLMESN